MFIMVKTLFDKFQMMLKGTFVIELKSEKWVFMQIKGHNSRNRNSVKEQ